MYVKETLELKNKHKYGTASFVLLILIALYVYGPFVGYPNARSMTGDTAIQVKLGMDGISSGHFILDEIYSWHPDLTFTAHESGWYLLVGFMYKYLGFLGLILTGTIFTYATVFLALRAIRDKAHPVINAVVLVLVPSLGGFPDYNVRPSASSIFCMLLLCVVMLSDNIKPLNKCFVFAGLSLALGWLHGGILPIFFMIMAVFMVVELLYKQWKTALMYFLAVIGGFGVSLLNPIGIRTWTFGLKQMGATDIWSLVIEWQPRTFSILESVAILLALIGFMCDEEVLKFDKKKITKLCILCMFFIATCKYQRFVNIYTLVYLVVAPEELSCLLTWINKNVFKFKVEKIKISDLFYYLTALVCFCLIIYSGVVFFTSVVKTNTFKDIEEMAAYDEEVVDFIKEHEYENIFNGFNSGSWLAFHGVKVHIDNRIDPYMEEYSGVDHIRGKLSMKNIRDMDRFVEEYHPDAFVFDLGTGDSNLVYEIETFGSDRYKIVYDKVVNSTLSTSLDTRWVIVECI